ncbi:NAD(+) diphosphatase [Wenzhouxiangella marina]|uniref:NAD(+) diphosphatase n=1 Tax=Wenzhouxiangella marina TaxID=1579979 RepID=A0A0K0XVD1_9GAMM|nr:NAD(+) diphosphatase [Wenzhouxiangella marina]AKS41582.1 NUDIX hydrolase [Wenzhouxiangella marina]MBB6086659.1 NAD+ diphosphatase [Wenzhouxiangella marina]
MSRDAHAPPELTYTGLKLDRSPALREREDWLEASLAHPDARVLPVWQARNLVEHRDGRPVPAARLDDLERASEVLLLGMAGEAPVLAADLSDLEREDADALTGSYDFVDLRKIGATLGREDAALLSYARGLVHWHRAHRHCGVCGQPTVSGRAGMVRTCSDPACAQPTFPRIDPAIIVLVEDPETDRCLLGRAAGWPGGVYSTLAGFVEPGESLEEAVAREVKEESGIDVDSVRYLASQPWPFPSSMMLGFQARARSTAITRHDEELEDARWFSREELQSAGTWGEDAEICLPREDSIARYLIEQWLNSQG